MLPHLAESSIDDLLASAVTPASCCLPSVTSLFASVVCVMVTGEEEVVTLLLPLLLPGE